MLRVFAYNHYGSFSLYDLAFIANFLYGRFNLHVINTIPFLFRAPGDTAFRRVVYRDLNCYFVTRQYPNIVHSELSGKMRRYYHIVGKSHFELCVRKCLHYHALKFNYIVFRQKNPSLIGIISINRPL